MDELQLLRIDYDCLAFAYTFSNWGVILQLLLVDSIYIHLEDVFSCIGKVLEVEGYSLLDIFELVVHVSLGVCHRED